MALKAKSSRSKPRPAPARIIPPEPEYIESGSEPVEYLSDEQEETIRSIVGRFGGEGLEIKVYKQLPGGGDQYWYTTDSDQIDEEKIRTVNGGIGGRFALKIFVGGELQKVKHMTIADAPGLASPGVSGNGSSDPMIAVLLQRLANIEQNLQRSPVQREPINDLADAMVKLDSLRGGGQAKELPVDQIIKCIELGKTLNGGGVVDDSFLSVIKDILKEAAPVILPLVMSGMKAAPQQLPQQTAGESEMEQAERIERRLKEGIVFLKKKCMQGSNPDLYLGLILESADSEEFARLIHIALTQEFAIFAKIDPEIEQPAYVKFFRHIYDGIRSEIAERDKLDDDTGGAGGDPPDTSSNVRVIKGGSK